MVDVRQQRVDVVGDEQDGEVSLAGDLADQLDDRALVAHVEVRKRLVHQQQARAADQRLREQQALLLAAGQAAERPVGVSPRRRPRGSQRR